MQMEEQEQWIYTKIHDSLTSAVNSFSETDKTSNLMFIRCESDIRKTIINAPDDCIVKLEHAEQPVFTMKISQMDDDKKIEEIHALCSESKLH